MGLWASVFLAPAFLLQGGTSSGPEFDLTSGPLSAAPASTSGQPVADPTAVQLAAPAAAPTTTAVVAARATTTSPPTTVERAREPSPTTTTTTVAARTPASSAPPNTAAPATTTTTPAVAITLPAALRPAQQRSVNTESGVASWFGAPSHTCAHRTLPFGTVIKVTSASTGVSTECTVADRGPADTSRVIDLSTDTFEHLADISVGLIDVVIEW